jgi:hypothetical protein
MGVIFLLVHLSITSIFIYKYSKEPEQVHLNKNNDMEKSTSQMTDISTITSDTL